MYMKILWKSLVYKNNNAPSEIIWQHYVAAAVWLTDAIWHLQGEQKSIQK